MSLVLGSIHRVPLPAAGTAPTTGDSTFDSPVRNTTLHSPASSHPRPPPLRYSSLTPHAAQQDSNSSRSWPSGSQIVQRYPVSTSRKSHNNGSQWNENDIRMHKFVHVYQLYKLSRVPRRTIRINCADCNVLVFSNGFPKSPLLLPRAAQAALAKFLWIIMVHWHSGSVPYCIDF